MKKIKKKITKNPFKEFFGSLKGWKIDAQAFKDEIRREEAEKEAQLDAQRSKTKSRKRRIHKVITV